MDFRHLEYFVEIAREKNITRAAEKLYVSQSAVNQYLLKIENDLGTQLFIRNRRNLTLTDAGQVYLNGCIKALQIRSDTLREIQDIVESSASSLTIALTPTRGLNMFTSIYPMIKKKYPDLEIRPIELTALNQQRAAANGEIDLGFMILPENMKDSLHYTDLGVEELILLVPSDNPLCTKYSWSEDHPERLPVIDLKEAADIPFALARQSSTFRMACDPIFTRAGFEPKVLIETSNTAHIAQVTETGMCCGILPYYYADFRNPHYRCFALTDHPVWHLYIARRNDAYLTHAAREFIRLSKNFWQERHLTANDEK